MSDGENFYLLMTTGDFNNEDQVFIEDRPSEMGIFDYRLSFGEAAGSFFPLTPGFISGLKIPGVI